MDFKTGIIGRERTGRRGFSLIEMLIALSIVILLVGILLVAVARTRRTASISRVRFDLQAVSQALGAFRDDHKGYPGMVQVPANAPMNQALAFGLIGPADNDNEPGPGFRLSAGGGRVFKPYLDMDRFKMARTPGPDNSMNTPDDIFRLQDSNGYFIHYYPRRRTLAQANPQTGSVLERPGASAPERGLYAEADQLVLENGDIPLSLRLVRYMLGDDDFNNVIDPNKGESLKFSEDFILASPGPDGVFVDEAKVSKEAVNGSDDVFNFTR